MAPLDDGHLDVHVGAHPGETDIDDAAAMDGNDDEKRLGQHGPLVVCSYALG